MKSEQLLPEFKPYALATLTRTNVADMTLACANVGGDHGLRPTGRLDFDDYV